MTSPLVLRSTVISAGAHLLVMVPRRHRLQCVQVLDGDRVAGFRARVLSAFDAHATVGAHTFVLPSSVVAVLPTPSSDALPLVELRIRSLLAELRERDAWAALAPRAFFSVADFIATALALLGPDAAAHRADAAELHAAAVLQLTAALSFRSLGDDLFACRPAAVVSELLACAALVRDVRRREAALDKLMDRREDLFHAFRAGVSAPTKVSADDPFPMQSTPVDSLPRASDGGAFAWPPAAAAKRAPDDVDVAVRALRHVATLRAYNTLVDEDWLDFVARVGMARPGRGTADRALRRLGAWHDRHNPFHVDALLHADVSPPPPFAQFFPSLERAHALGDVDAQLRVDFGDTVALAIDDASTVDVDDAVSVERTSSGDVWVHVHVADVTSFRALQFATPLEREAAKRATSVYLPECTYAMMPHEVVSHCGLDAGERAGGAPVPALTFSMLLDRATGALTSWRVQPTRVTVKRLTYEAADAILSDVASPLTDGLPARVADDVRLLYAIAQQRVCYRRSAGAVLMHFPRPIVKVAADGTIAVKAEFVRTASSVLIEELMVLAGEAAAREVLVRGVAAPFRAQTAPVDAAAFRRDVNTAMAANDLPTIFSLLHVPERATTSCAPLPHAGVGLAAYCRATSPLRRYNDLLLHHQLKRVLRRDEPLSAAEMAPLVAHADVLARNAKFLQRSSEWYWINTHLLRTSVPAYRQAHVLPTATGRRDTRHRLLRCRVLSVRAPSPLPAAAADSGKSDAFKRARDSVAVVMHDDTALVTQALFDPAKQPCAVGDRVAVEIEELDSFGLMVRVRAALPK
jgi:hypothetical protein